MKTMLNRMFFFITDKLISISQSSPQATFREPSRSLPANEGITSTRSLPIGTFDNNVAHSNKGSGFATYPSGYFPNGRETINNFDSYKNGGHGAFFAQSQNITLNTGVFSGELISNSPFI